MRQAYDKLEKLVYERTEELLLANNALKREVRERRRTEALLREAHENLERLVEEMEHRKADEIVGTTDDRRSTLAVKLEWWNHQTFRRIIDGLTIFQTMPDMY